MAEKPRLPKEFLKKLKAVVAKRAKTVIDHVLEHGFITTEELKELYGYNHPPRAIQDVKDYGIPIEMYRVSGKDGRKISAYRFGDPSLVRGQSHSGRRALPKSLKRALLERDGSKCAICLAIQDARSLQIDHRVPYQVVGDKLGDLDLDDFFLICGSCNRAKSWACEHCQNWLSAKKAATCLTCYWGSPKEYTHIALQQIRRLDLVWQANEIVDFDALSILAKPGAASLPDYVKDALRRHVENAAKPSI